MEINGQPKILVTAPFPPSKAPEADHAYYLCEHLARAGWRVNVLTNEGSVAAAHPRVTVHSVMRDWSWRDLPRWAWALRRCRPDATMLIHIGCIASQTDLSARLRHGALQLWDKAVATVTTSLHESD